MATPRKRSRLHPLQAEIAGVLGEDKLAELIGISKLRRAWADIVGPMMAGRTEPIEIENRAGGGNCLWVAVDHPIMAQQIRFLQNDIRQACFRLCRVSSLSHIRTRIRDGAGIMQQKQKLKSRPVTLSQKKQLACELRDIRDADLRYAIFQARIAQLAFGEIENTD
ncbi:MAG: DciA family protein [Mariprofundaceae bacterium]